MDFFRGDALNLRNRISRVLPHWDASVPGYSYVLGMHAFGLEEMNQYPEAEAPRCARLSMQPKDGWAVHAAVHVMEMQGRIDEGIAFLRRARRLGARTTRSRSTTSGTSRCSTWTARATTRRSRCSIGTCIRGRRRTSCRWSTRRALLWRLQLEGVDVGDRFERVADDWEARLDSEAGFYAFNDVHAAMAFAHAGRDAALLELDGAHGRARRARATPTRR